MQNTNNIIIKAALAVFAAFLATGCIFEKMAMPEDLQSVLIQVNVSSGDMKTKADPTTEEATATEAAINTIRIYAFHNGRLSGHYYGENVSDESILMDLEIPAGTPSVDFYVIANEANMRNGNSAVAISNRLTAAELENLTFTSFDEDAPLPMYCKEEKTINVPEIINSTVNEEDGHQGHLILPDKVTFMLERPMAKIAFYAASKSGSVTPIIEEVSVYAKGTREYMYLFEQQQSTLLNIPVGDENKILHNSPLTVDKVLTDGNRDNVNAYTEVSKSSYLSEIPFGSDKWDEHNSYNSVVLHVRYRLKEGGEISDNYIYMPPIIRNHFYKVLCLISPEGGITVDYLVSDWEKVDEWNLNYEYPTYEVETPSSETQATMYYDNGTENGAFCLDFKMTAPASQKWTPTIQADAADYAVKVYKGSQLVETPVEVSDDLYTIKVVPLKSENIGKEVKFIITYNPIWSLHSELLLINEGVMWTGTGASSDLIVIKQVDKN